MRLLFKSLNLFGLLFALVLLVNIPVISYNMMYPEQPLFYLANQSITHFKDLIAIFLHPKLFDYAVPFFRPTGHFLLYQLIIPILGWHNTKGLIIVNLGFLALTGFLVIRIYRLLFPDYKVGGYLAFSLYLMHPTLMLSRFMIMHFDFAYIGFMMLGLYYFILFCQKNIPISYKAKHIELKNIEFKHFHLLVLTLFFYAIAATCKEPALLLAPICIVFFCIFLYEKQSIKIFLMELFRQRQVRQILILFLVASITLFMYLTLAWPILSHPLRPTLRIANSMASINEFLKDGFGLSKDIIPRGTLAAPNDPLRAIVFSTMSRMLIGLFFIFALAGTLITWTRKVGQENKKSLLFLWLAFFICLALPIVWGLGYPWHFSSAILFMTMIMGFGAEYCFRLFFKKKYISINYSIALLIACSGYFVNQQNINKYNLDQHYAFSIKLGRNAVFNPPPIQDKLSSDSLILVEDNFLHDEHLLGDSAYPFYILKQFNYEDLFKLQQSYFRNFQPHYNGTLFHWAYLMPSLREEIYPFQASQLQEIPSAMIYLWLQNVNNIFCLGYDQNANWHDDTEMFKRNLLKEKSRRNLTVNTYNEMPAVPVSGSSLYTKNLPFPDSSLCQYECDQNKKCGGFTYIFTTVKNRVLMQCEFYQLAVYNETQFCPACTGFVKK